MTLHAAAMVAFFVDHVKQAPVVVQSVQTVPEEWKWWFGALAPWVGPLLSGVVSIYVAWKLFHWQGEKDRKQWIRDQKKAEWSALLRSVAYVFHISYVNTLNGWYREKADRIATELGQALEEISIACASCIFLDNFRQNNEGGKKIEEFIKKTELQAQNLKGYLGLFDSQIDKIHNADSETDKNNNVKDFDRNREITSDLIFDLAKQSRTLLDWLQNEAALDLGVTAKGKKPQPQGDGQSYSTSQGREKEYSESVTINPPAL